MKQIAIVVLNWNGEDPLKKYLPSLIDKSKGENVKLIVADNGSDDSSLSLLENDFPQVEIIKLDKNYGFAGGYNKALSKIETDYYCLLNSDVRVSDHWIKPAVACLEKHPDIAAVQPKIRSDRNPDFFEHAGAAGGFIDQYGYPFCRGRIMDNIEKDDGQYNEAGDIFWASGACLFIRSNCFWAAGGFDSDFFAHMEEIDLCWRLKNMGYRIAYCPESTVFHWGGATLDYENPRKLFLNFRNSLWCLYKNYTGKHLAWIMFKRMLIDTAAIAKFTLTFDFKNAFAIIQAHIAFYKSLSELRKKRQKNQATVKQTKHHSQYRGSIVISYFLGKKKEFSMLNFKSTEREILDVRQ